MIPVTEELLVQQGSSFVKHYQYALWGYKPTSQARNADSDRDKVSQTQEQKRKGEKNKIV